MTKLNKSQVDFLNKHKIPISATFDATGLTRKIYREVMEEAGQWVAYGVTPCRREGHTLRTRTGSCVQCGPAQLAFLLRHLNKGMVYIAGTRSGSFLKVGTAIDADARIKSLNGWGYAGVDDWQLISAFDCEKAGEVEHLAQTRLANYQYPTSYLRGDRKTDCLETFRCNYKKAKDALESIEGYELRRKFTSPELEKYFDNINNEYGSHIRKGNIHSNGGSKPVEEVLSQKKNAPKETQKTTSMEEKSFTSRPPLQTHQGEKTKGAATAHAAPLPGAASQPSHKNENGGPSIWRICLGLLIVILVLRGLGKL